MDRFSSQLHEISETILQMSKQSLGKAKWLNQLIKMVSGRTVIWLQPPVSLPTLWTLGQQRLSYPYLSLQHQAHYAQHRGNVQSPLSKAGKALKKCHVVDQPRRISSRTKPPVASSLYLPDMWPTQGLSGYSSCRDRALHQNKRKSFSSPSSDPRSPFTALGCRLSYWNVTHFKL